MILDFHCNETEKIWHGVVSRRLPRDMQQVALRKLFMLDKAQTLDDLRIPPATAAQATQPSRPVRWVR